MDQWTACNIQRLAELVGLDPADPDPVAVTAVAAVRIARLADANERLTAVADAARAWRDTVCLPPSVDAGTPCGCPAHDRASGPVLDALDALDADRGSARLRAVLDEVYAEQPDARPDEHEIDAAGRRLGTQEDRP